jgi:hypothetical protein
VELTSTLRGGASVDTDDEDDEDEMEESEYDEWADEEEEEESMITHAASTPGSKSSDAATKNNKKVTLVTSTQELIRKKQTTEMKSQIKKAVSASSTSSSSSSKKKSSGNSLYKRYVPYIIRATLNPITLWTMTKAYFVSLCDINYGKEVSRTEKYKSTICLFVCLFVLGSDGEALSEKNKTRSMYIYATKLLDHTLHYGPNIHFVPCVGFYLEN